MAVAAYASLLSLSQVLNSVRNHAELRNIHADIKQIETLRERVNYLVGFLEIHHQSEDERLNGLWRNISKIAFEAEEMFDLHVVNQLLRERSAENEDKRSMVSGGEHEDVERSGEQEDRRDSLASRGVIQEIEKDKRSVLPVESARTWRAKLKDKWDDFLAVLRNQLPKRCNKGGKSALRKDVVNQLGERSGGEQEDKTDLGALREDEEIAIEHEKETFDLPVDSSQLVQRSKKRVLREDEAVEDKRSVVASGHESEDVKDKMDFHALHEDVEILIQKIEEVQRAVDQIKTELPELVEVQGHVVRVGRQPKASMSVGGKNIMVGFDEHRLHIMDELTKHKGSLKIIPITGMGGIGKTTLAKNVFEDPCIVEHFHMKIWVTISQTYSVHEILTGLLNNGVEERSSEDLKSLGDTLYKKLFGKRYLIVMDDMWDIQSWYDFKRFFPDNGNGSRIMVTTRLENVASSLGSCDPYSISFLDMETSWNLFCQTIFGQDDCPFPELEEIGRRIASSCRGLPLEVIAIGGLLANSKMTKEFWESVAENVSSLANSGYDEHCFQILLLSYNNLPIHLKPCFLYLRSYPEDHFIKVPELVHRWVAEGFIKKPEDGQSLEEIAMEYLKDLISRNLVFIRRWDWNLKFCGVHDLFRDLCLRESNKQCFIRSPIVQHPKSFNPYYCFQCGEQRSATIIGKIFRAAKSVANRIFFSRSHGAVNIASLSQMSPSVCGACKEMYSKLTKPRLVRIFINKDSDLEDERNYVHSTQSRYVMTHFTKVKFIFPSRIHLLWNLQILGIPWASNTVVLPKWIWRLPEIRHIRIGSMFIGPGAAILPNPEDEDNDVEGKDFFILKNLQTLSRIVNLKFTQNLLDRIPNLKTLEIQYRDDEPIKPVNHFLGNLYRIKTLKSLSLLDYMLDSIVFPNSLKELFLVRCKFSWENMSTIGLLPHLEVLSLKSSGVGREWAPDEEEFLQLRVLEIVNCDLVRWRADETNFPSLEKLILNRLQHLRIIPSGIGYIDTLQTIELYDLHEDAITRAKCIWEEQRNNGNYSLQIHVYKDNTHIEF